MSFRENSSLSLAGTVEMQGGGALWWANAGAARTMTILPGARLIGSGPERIVSQCIPHRPGPAEIVQFQPETLPRLRVAVNGVSREIRLEIFCGEEAMLKRGHRP